jgi:hypothetical protein
MHSEHFVAHHVVVMRVSTESLGSTDFSVLRGETIVGESLRIKHWSNRYGDGLT